MDWVFGGYAEVARRHGAVAIGAKEFLDAVTEDASKSLGLIRLVMAQPGISSMLVDNVNGSIHLRALLTDRYEETYVNKTVRPSGHNITSNFSNDKGGSIPPNRFDAETREQKPLHETVR